jgi:hypothetical protein
MADNIKARDIVYLVITCILLVFLLVLAIYLQVNYVKKHTVHNGNDDDIKTDTVDAGLVTQNTIKSTEIKMFSFEQEKLVKAENITVENGFLLLPTTINEENYFRLIGLGSQSSIWTVFDTKIPSHDIFALYDDGFVYLDENDEVVVISSDGNERLRLQNFHYLGKINNKWFAFDYEHSFVIREDSITSPQNITDVYEVIGRGFYNSSNYVLRTVRRERGDNIVALLENEKSSELSIQNVHCICMDDSFAVATNKHGDICVTSLSTLAMYTNLKSLPNVKFITSCQNMSNGIFLMVTYDGMCFLVDLRRDVTILMNISWPLEMVDVDDRMTVVFSDDKELMIFSNTPHALLFSCTDSSRNVFNIHIIAHSEKLEYFHVLHENNLYTYSQDNDYMLCSNRFQRNTI